MEAIVAKEKSNENLMTEGNVWKLILLFALPLLAGNLFQQLYNTVDSIVVGNYVGSEALAAVGSSGSLINLLVGMFTGISTGAGVLIAQYYGAGEEEKLKGAVHTAMTLAIIGGIALIFIGILSSGALLKWMGTPDNVMPNSIKYLRIFFLGSLFNLVYNMAAGILRAVGDARHPLYYLIVASIVNIILDLVFVVVIPLGVAGVGIATVCAQGVSAILVVYQMLRSKAAYRLIPKELKINRHYCKRILSLGIPSGIQGCIISLSNVVVQSNINSFGDLVMAGCSSYVKIDGFVLLPVMSFSMAIMTFAGQNVGAGRYDRVKKGVFVTNILCCIYVAIMSVVLFKFGGNILSIFNKKPEVIHYGLVMLKILLPFYLSIALVNVFTGAFRGAGKAMASMLIMALNLCVVRVIWVGIMTPIFPKIETVLWGYPVSWVTGFLCCVIYAMKGKWLEHE